MGSAFKRTVTLPLKYIPAFPFAHSALEEKLSTEQLRHAVMQHSLTAWPMFHLDLKPLKTMNV